MPELISVTGGPTKPEIIAVSLFKLNLSDGDVFADVGCGTGLISIEATRFAKNLTIYAMDAREVAVNAATDELLEFRGQNAQVFSGVFSSLPIGKSGLRVCREKNITAVLYALMKKRAFHYRQRLRIETVFA